MQAGRRSCRIGDVNDRAIGSERDPLRHGAGGGVVGRIDIGQQAVPVQLEVGQRIFKDGIGNRAPNPERFSIGSNPDAMGGSIEAHLSVTIPTGLIGEFDASDFDMLGEINDGKSIEVGELHEDVLRGAIGICIESHRAHAIVKFDFPGNLLGLEIHDRCRFGFDGAGYGVFPVRRDVNVVDAPVDCNLKGNGKLKWKGETEKPMSRRQIKKAEREKRKAGERRLKGEEVVEDEEEATVVELEQCKGTVTVKKRSSAPRVDQPRPARRYQRRSAAGLGESAA